MHGNKAKKKCWMITQLEFHKISRANNLKLADNKKQSLLNLDKLNKGTCIKRGV